MTQQDLDKLMRENEKLKKSLEKEKFFSNLLDKELKEAKAEVESRSPAEFYPQRRGVSRGAFNLVLILFLGATAFLAYTLYYNKQYNLFPEAGSLSGTPNAEEGVDADQVGLPNSGGNGAAVNSSASDNNATALPGANADNRNSSAGKLKDSVPNIIGAGRNGSETTASRTGTNNSNNTSSSAPSGNTSSAAVPRTEQPVSRTENTAARRTQGERAQTQTQTRPAQTGTNRNEESGSTNATGSNSTSTNTTGSTTTGANTTGSNAGVPVTPPPAPAESRPVVGKYKVTSKANFYNSPDENTLKGSFIRQSSNRVVDALEDRNGFIYVVYTNDLGYTTRGWLSKKDLTKVD